MKICSKCKLEQSLNDFDKRLESKDGLKSACKTCTSKHNKAHYKKSSKRRISVRLNIKRHKDSLFQKTVNFLKQHPCVVCSESDILKLEFDHLHDKEFNISEGLVKGYAWERIEKEIAKCQVLCANCHAVKSAHQLGNWKIKFI